jgi:hypothetical protein
MTQPQLQDISFPITLSIPEVEVILAGLMKVMKEVADPIYTKLQQAALAEIQKVQVQGASNNQVQADINQAEANSDSMRNE